MKRFISLLCGLALALGAAQAPEACTSIRIEGLKDVKALKTIVGGKVVYEAK
jgi:hypothetical protein